MRYKSPCILEKLKATNMWFVVKIYVPLRQHTRFQVKEASPGCRHNLNCLIEMRRQKVFRPLFHYTLYH